MSGKENLIIFDTTLRDGEQCPGASMNTQEKLQVAKALEALRVDVIEAGFPISSPGDFEGVQEIAKQIKGCSIAALARSVPVDIDRAGEALKPAERPRIHTFIATSPIHMQKKLNLSPEQVIERATKAIQQARQYTNDVEFSAEDAGRSEVDFLCKIIEACINAGATTINIPDTVGYTLPHQYGELLRTLIERVPNSDKAIFSTHCHNDLGLAVANSLSGVLGGARQVECTINGIGERAGNAALEEVVMAVRTRQDMFPCDVQIDTTQLVPTSQLVSEITGFVVQRNKAIVGSNAFAHEAGIHQDGVLKNRETYEIMRAEMVGWDSNVLVLGKHSGHNALNKKLEAMGLTATAQQLDTLYQQFKCLADEKKEVADSDIRQLYEKIKQQPQ